MGTKLSEVYRQTAIGIGSILTNGEDTYVVAQAGPAKSKNVSLVNLKTFLRKTICVAVKNTSALDTDEAIKLVGKKLDRWTILSRRDVFKA